MERPQRRYHRLWFNDNLDRYKRFLGGPTFLPNRQLLMFSFGSIMVGHDYQKRGFITPRPKTVFLYLR